MSELPYGSLNGDKMVKQNLEIQLLYFDACPSWKKAHEILSETLKELDMHQEVQLIRVETQEDAEKTKFTGSPMITVNGEDIFPTGQDSYALGCRIFQTPEGYQGWPTKEMVVSKLAQIIG